MAWVSHRGRWLWVSRLELAQASTTRSGADVAGDVVLFAMPGAAHGAVGSVTRETARRRAQQELLRYYAGSCGQQSRSSSPDGVSSDEEGNQPCAQASPDTAARASVTCAFAASLSDDVECPICLEPLCADTTVHGVYCGHALHLACLTGLVKHSVSCPQCRASLLPPELEHLAPAFTPAGARTWATQEGFHPAAGGVITADDFDLDSEDDLEDLQSGPLTVAELGRRWEARHRRAASLNGLSVDDHLLLTMRLRRQHFPLTRAFCAKISLVMFLTLIGLVLFLMVGSFSQSRSAGGGG